MQSDIRLSRGYAYSLRWVLLAWALALPGAPGFAADAALNAEVPAERWKALRLKGLPKDASVAVRVETSGPIIIIFLHQDELKRFPDVARPAFVGTAERRLSFRVTVPVAGTYYVILDNRKGAAMRDVRLLIRALPARRPEAKPPRKQPGPQGLDAT
jgi:hypothetical protein